MIIFFVVSLIVYKQQLSDFNRSGDFAANCQYDLSSSYNGSCSYFLFRYCSCYIPDVVATTFIKIFNFNLHFCFNHIPFLTNSSPNSTTVSIIHLFVTVQTYILFLLLLNQQLYVPFRSYYIPVKIQFRLKICSFSRRY